MAKKSGFTIEQHKALGTELQEINDRLDKIITDLSHAYPSDLCDVAREASKNIYSLRDALDDKVCGEHQDMMNLERLYYGRASIQKSQRHGTL